MRPTCKSTEGNTLESRSGLRRGLILAAAFGLAVQLISSAPGQPAVAAERATSPVSTQPNFVLVLTDDQRWDTIGRCLPTFDPTDYAAGAGSCMPFLQQDLMPAGVTFERGYVTTSLCCPSRASILTGQLQSHHGVVDNDGFAEFDDHSTLATWLDDAGYRTGLFGKYLNGYGNDGQPQYIPPGWDSWHAFFGGVGYKTYPLLEKESGQPAGLNSYDDLTDSTNNVACRANNFYSTDLLCRRALDFLAADTTTPFFLYFAPLAPHEPPLPSTRYLGLYTGNNLHQPTYASYNSVPTPNPPSWLLPQPFTANGLNQIEVNFRKALMANRAADDALHALYQQVSTQGQLDNTVWVFMSDNGLAAGEHRYDGKACEYEECHKVPFVVACPPTVCPGASAGVVDGDHQVLNIDLAPTFAQLAGVTPGVRVDGTSLVPLLENVASPWRSSFLISDAGQKPGTSHGIVEDVAGDDTYKYVRFDATGETEMYDLSTDPWEMANLIGDGVHAAVEQQLADELAQRLATPSLALTAGPGPITNQTDVQFDWTSTESLPFDCSLDDAPAAPCGSGTVGTQSYAGLAEGLHTFSVEAVDADNNVGRATQDFTVDTSWVPPPPDTTPPVTVLKTPTADRILRTRNVTASWKATDAVGVVGYQLLERLGLGGTQAQVYAGIAKSMAKTGALGSTYCYQAVGADAAGNLGASSEACEAVPMDDSDAAITYTGAVTHVTDAGAFEGTLSVLNGPGERADSAVVGRKIAILAEKGPSSGKCSLFVDGTLKKTVDLYSAAPRSASMVWQGPVVQGPHTVSVVWLNKKNAQSSGTQVGLDGIGVVA